MEFINYGEYINWGKDGERSSKRMNLFETHPR